MTTQDLVSQVVRHTNNCYFTMVAIGPDGRPVEVPMWQPRTAEERRWHEAAGRRREVERATSEIRQATST